MCSQISEEKALNRLRQMGVRFLEALFKPRIVIWETETTKLVVVLTHKEVLVFINESIESVRECWRIIPFISDKINIKTKLILIVS